MGIKQENISNILKNVEYTKVETIYNKSKRKRMRRRQDKKVEFSMKLFGNNVNSLASKMESLENLLRVEKPSAVFLQETKLGRAGKIRTPSSISSYTWYELHRTRTAEKGKGGGGIALGVMNCLQPSWISEGNDNIEALTVEIWVEGFPVRLVYAYGPQEYDQKERKELFWQYIQKEVTNSKKNGAGLIIQFDGNLWAGKTIIPGDPNIQNGNGKIFENFLQRNLHLSVINALPICQGKITRTAQL